MISTLSDDCSFARVLLMPIAGMATVKAMEKAGGLLSTYVADGAVMLIALPSARKGCVGLPLTACIV
jgi:hypothetical protein